MATVPSFQTSSAPTTRPKMVQPAERWRDTSSSISSGARRPARSRALSESLGDAVASPSRAGGSGASVMPVAREFSDTGLDLVKGDMTQPPRGDDLLTIY